MSELAHLSRNDDDLKDDYEDVEMVTKAVMEIKTTYVPKPVEANPRYENSEVLAEMWREAQEARAAQGSLDVKDPIESEKNEQIVKSHDEEPEEECYENQEVIEVHEEIARVDTAQDIENSQRSESAHKEEEGEEEQPIIDIETARKEMGKQFRQNFFGLHQSDDQEEDDEDADRNEEDASKLDSDDPGTETLDVTIELPDTSTAPLPDPSGLGQGQDEDEVKDDETIADFFDDPRDPGEVEDEEQESYDWNEMESDNDGNLISTTLQEKLRST